MKKEIRYSDYLPDNWADLTDFTMLSDYKTAQKVFNGLLEAELERIQDGKRAIQKYNDMNRDYNAALPFVLGDLFRIGIVTGIRAERARKKAA